MAQPDVRKSADSFGRKTLPGEKGAARDWILVEAANRAVSSGRAPIASRKNGKAKLEKRSA